MVSEELIEKFTQMKQSYIEAINLLEQVQTSIERLNQDVSEITYAHISETFESHIAGKIERLSSEIHELRARLSTTWGFKTLVRVD